MVHKWNFKKIICYAAILLLCLFYCSIFYQGIRPNVCEEYQMFYIDITLKDWPGLGGLAYEPGTKLVFKNDDNLPNRVKNRGKGWDELEEDGCRNAAGQAELYFRGLPDNNYILSLEFTEIKSKIDVFMNGKFIGQISEQDKMKHALNLPNELIKDGKIDIIFEAETGNFKMKSVSINRV